jgi:phosphoglycolate phosphatase-like HAD superfamily hydrolase
VQNTFPFDAVLFDLDGTLVATDRFWVQAARTGARRAFLELQLDRAIPSAEEWMGLVGQPLDVGFEQLFGDLDPVQRRRVQEICVEEEHRLLDAGGAAWMPGGEAALATLAKAGVRIGIASNCSQSYLDHMLNVLGVARFAEEARCLDSPGVHNKGDMIASLLESFDTRSAVFVGDRVGDRDSAWSNSIPHVHCAFGFAGRGEEIEAQAVIEDLGELIPRLSKRAAWVDDCLERAGLFRGSRRPNFSVAVTGLPLSGKSLFAREAVLACRARGIPAALAELNHWRREAAAEDNQREDPLDGIDIERLRDELLLPLGRGDALSLDLLEVDHLGIEHPRHLELESGGILFLVGEGLLDPRLAGDLERSLWLEVSEEEVLRRAAGREGRALGPGPLEALRSGRLARARTHRERYDPRRLADWVVEAENPLGPA